MADSSGDTALLVMDMQASILTMLPHPLPFVTSVAKAIRFARSRKIPVIYVVVGFRNGFPEVSQSNKAFLAARERWLKQDPEELVKIEPSLAPLPGDIVVTKRRVSAFTGSDLEVVLRAFGTRHLVLTGCATSGVVLSTTREAADKDYRITILSDGCEDRDPEVHEVLMTKIFPRQADVMKVDEWEAL